MMVESVKYARNARVSPPRAIKEARESLLMVTPRIDENTLDSLFALSRPVDVSLLTTRDGVRQDGRTLRNHLKQLQDINHHVDVRVTDERFPAFAIVDGEHIHCYSRASLQFAAKKPEGLVKAAESLWERSTPLESKHLADNATVPSA